MAETQSSDLTSLHPTQELVGQIMDLQRAAPVMLGVGLVQQQDLTLPGGFTKRFPRYNVAPTVTMVAEDASLTAVTISVTHTDVTVAEGAILRTVTKKAALAAGYNTPREYLDVILGRDATDLWLAVETDLCEQLADFTSSVGTTTSDLTLDTFAAAIAAADLLNARVGGRRYAAVLHPNGIGQLRADAINSGSMTVASVSGQLMRPMDTQPGAPFDLMSVWVYQSTQVTYTAGPPAYYVGGLFPMALAANDVEAPIALVTKGTPEVLYETTAADRKVKGTISYFWGTDCVNTSRGCNITHAA